MRRPYLPIGLAATAAVGQSVRVSHWWELQPGDPQGFTEWLRSLYRFDAADPGEVEPDNRRWLCGYFNDNGPVEAETVRRAFQARQVGVATKAVDAVRSDLQRTTSERPSLIVELDEWGGVRVAVDGGYSGSPVSHIEPAEVLVEVADDVQDQLQGVVVDGAWRFWPDCRQHNAGLHAEIHDARAVWWCRLGNHELAPIGQLGQSA
jgi:hypothetical protein